MNKVVSSIILSLLILGKVFGQVTSELPKNSMQVFFGSSFHGTDNVLGVAFLAEYSHYFHKKLNYTAFAGTTIHDGIADVRYWNSDGQVVDGTVNFTTAGLQAGVAIGYSFYRSTRHHVQGSLGIFLRYQTTSNPDILVFSTTYPYMGIDYRAHSVAFGGVAAISYDYTFNNNAFIGAKTWLQYDSNDDALNIFSFVVGKRF